MDIWKTIVGILFIIAMAIIVWKFKWFILSLSLIAVLIDMLHMKITGKGSFINKD